MLKQKTKSQREVIFIKLYPFLKEGQKQYILLCMLKVWALLLSLVTPVFYLLLINNVMIDGNITLLPWVIAGYIAVYLMQTFGVVLGKRSYNKLFIKFKLKLKTKRF
jgi:ATP-binding cassette subfamily B protein/subfamily B ATP-binding cassette protein MsbA